MSDLAPENGNAPRRPADSTQVPAPHRPMQLSASHSLEAQPRSELGVALLLGWLFLAFSLLAITYAWHNAVIDDAYITFRYAANLVKGNGLVFNVGERVEGYTSFLWTLLMAVGIWLELDPPRVAQVLAVISNLFLVGSCYFFSRRSWKHPAIVALIAPTLLLANLNTGAWAAHGLETSLFSLLVLLGLLSSAPRETGELPAGKRAVGSGILLALASLTRPEGLMYTGLAFLPRMYRMIRKRRLGAGDLAFASSALLPIALHFLWRHAYYGEWLPNTYFAKADGGAGLVDDGIRYLIEFFDQSLVYGLALLPLAGMAPRSARGARPLLLLAILCTVVYTARVGGDTFAGARFLLPVLAPFYLLLQDGLATFLRSLPPLRPIFAALVFLLGLATVFGTGSSLTRQAEIAESMTRNRVFLGKLLREITPEETSLTLTTVGALPYYAERTTIDMYGLVDAHIAHLPVKAARTGHTGHAKGDGAYILARKPDLILLRNVWITDVPIEDHRSLHGPSEHEIAASEVFARDYVPVNLKLRDDLLFGFYARKDFPLETLQKRFDALDLKKLGPLDKLEGERGIEILLHREGQQLAKAGRLEEAYALYQKALALYPRDGQVQLSMGQVCEEEGKLELAREHYQLSTTLLSESGYAWLGLGNVEAKMNNNVAALQAYKRATVADASLVDAYANSASVLLREAQFAAAIPLLEEAVKRAPEDLEMWIKLGTAAGQVRRWNKAREALERARILGPEDRKTRALERWLEGRLAEGR